MVTNYTHQKNYEIFIFHLFNQVIKGNPGWFIYVFHLLLNRSFINFCFSNDIGIALHCCVWFHWIGLTVNNIFIFQVFFSQLLYCHDHTPKYEVISECWLIWHFINKMSNSCGRSYQIKGDGDTSNQGVLKDILGNFLL